MRWVFTRLITFRWNYQNSGPQSVNLREKKEHESREEIPFYRTFISYQQLSINSARYTRKYVYNIDLIILTMLCRVIQVNCNTINECFDRMGDRPRSLKCLIEVQRELTWVVEADVLQRQQLGCSLLGVQCSNIDARKFFHKIKKKNFLSSTEPAR